MTKPGSPEHAAGEESSAGAVVEIDAMDLDEWEKDQHTPVADEPRLAALVRQSAAPPDPPRTATLPRAPTAAGARATASTIARAPTSGGAATGARITTGAAPTTARPAPAIARPAPAAARPAPAAARPSATPRSIPSVRSTRPTTPAPVTSTAAAARPPTSGRDTTLGTAPGPTLGSASGPAPAARSGSTAVIGPPLAAALEVATPASGTPVASTSPLPLPLPAPPRSPSPPGSPRSAPAAAVAARATGSVDALPALQYPTAAPADLPAALTADPAARLEPAAAPAPEVRSSTPRLARGPRSWLRSPRIIAVIAAAVVLVAIVIAFAASGRDTPAPSSARVADPADDTGVRAREPAPAPVAAESPTHAPAASRTGPGRVATAPAEDASPEELAPAEVPVIEEPAPTPAPRRRASNRIAGKQVVLEYDSQARDAARASAASTPTDDAAIRRARASYNAGNQRLFAGDAVGAIRFYRQSLAIYPGYVAGYRGLGLAYSQQGDKPRALRALRTYIRTVPRANDVPLIKKRISGLRSR